MNSDELSRIESASFAAVEVWNEIYDIDTRRGAALVLGKLILPDEHLDLQEWVGTAVIKGSEGFFG